MAKSNILSTTNTVITKDVPSYEMLWKMPPSLAAKLGAIVIHAEEWLSSDSHGFDKIALEGLIEDPEVKAFILELGPLAPVKRNR